MKNAERFLLHCCAYTVLICALFLVFVNLSGFTDASLSIGRFFLMFLFSLLISIAEIILGIKSWHLVFRVLIHYTVLLAAFTVVFVISGNIKASGSGAIFSATIIFTFLYVVISLLVYFIKKSVSVIDKRIQNKGEKTNANKHTAYIPRYKSED